MQTLPVDQLLSQLTTLALREPGGGVAFDGDGTLWAGDIGEDYFAALLEAGTLTELARAALVREAEAEGVDPSGDATTLARRIHAAYVAGEFPEERVCEIMTWACAGWTAAELDAFAERVIASLSLHGRLHAEALRVVRWAEAQGVPVYLVSASPRAIVEQGARLVGIDLGRVAAATELRDAGGVVQPDVHRPIPYGLGKVARLRAMLDGRALYAAFGDNAFDVPMLCEARVPVAIRPKPRLVARAADVPGIAVLEPAAG